jgi:hypothetical protein
VASAYEWMAGQLRDAGVTGPEIERLDRQSQHCSRSRRNRQM